MRQLIKGNVTSLTLSLTQKKLYFHGKQTFTSPKLLNFEQISACARAEPLTLGFTVALCTQTCAAGGAVGPVVGGLAILEGEE